MKNLEFLFFAACALLVLVGGVCTVAARNPIRGAMGLLATIVGIAGMYLQLSAEFLAAIQILVYAGAVVVLFLFVIMILGPSATSGRDARTAVPRYLAATVFLATSAGALYLLLHQGGAPHAPLGPAPVGLGTIEGIGAQLFTTDLAAFELSGALLLVAVVGAVAVARGKQVDPTLGPSSVKAFAGAPPPPQVPAHEHGAALGRHTPEQPAHGAQAGERPRAIPDHAIAKEAAS